MLQLLGRDCYDIDIAIDNMLGKDFCDKVNEYLSSKGEEAHGIGVIQWYVPLFFLSFSLYLSQYHRTSALLPLFNIKLLKVIMFEVYTQRERKMQNLVANYIY